MIELRAVAWDHPDSERLRAGQQAELAGRYGRPDSEPGPKPTASDMSAFFVAYDGAEAIGCGGLRTLDERHGEIKRMYVVPDRRGTGVARAILRHLEVEAQDRGWERLVLETGDEQPDAMRFYEREGYARIPNFGYYADSELSVCYEKRFGEPIHVDAAGLTGLRIARADAEDAPELLVLQRACWVAEALDNETLAIPALHESLDDVVRGIAEQQTWVVRSGPRLVGSVRGRIAGDAWEIGRLMVAPDLAGRGLGRFLLRWIEQHRPDGIDRLVLFTGARSTRNLRLYGGAGYVVDRTAGGVAHLSKSARESSDGDSR